MAATYGPQQTTAKDRVRFLIGDTSSPFSLQDEEIEARLQIERNEWLAAAVCAMQIQGLGAGAVRKRVGDLELEFSDSADNAYQRQIDWLREKGAELLQGDSRITFTVL